MDKCIPKLIVMCCCGVGEKLTSVTGRYYTKEKKTKKKTNYYDSFGVSFYKTQKIDTDTGRIKCHPECLGGCVNETAQGCRVCKSYNDDGTCVKKCPTDKFSFKPRMMCVSAHVCREAERIPYDGKCGTKCPPKTNPYVYTDPLLRINITSCRPCPRCMRKCGWVPPIDTLSMISQLHGCQYLEGELSIQLPSASPNTMELLEHNLSDLQVINGTLKIHRSPAITSLSFLRSLHTVTGDSLEADSFLESGNFSVIIINNENLQSLWNLTERPTFNLTRGNIMIAFNSKLCLSEIHRFQRTMVLNLQQSGHMVDPNSNGYEQTCMAKRIKSSSKILTHESVTITWSRFDVPLAQRVYAYIIYYVEAPVRNISRIGMDAYSCTQ